MQNKYNWCQDSIFYFIHFRSKSQENIYKSCNKPTKRMFLRVISKARLEQCGQQLESLAVIHETSSQRCWSGSGLPVHDGAGLRQHHLRLLPQTVCHRVHPWWSCSRIGYFWSLWILEFSSFAEKNWPEQNWFDRHGKSCGNIVNVCHFYLGRWLTIRRGLL